MKAKTVVLSLILLVLGFLISFSYRVTEQNADDPQMTDEEWNRNIKIRNDLNELEERNLALQNEVFSKQSKLMEIERDLAESEEQLVSFAEQAEKLRMFIGEIRVLGEGIIVSIDDGEYNPLNGNINDFIVHEHHVFKVVNELYASGAEAIAINGQRLTPHSYIVCDGPVITVDGEKFPAPFVISAIGKPDVLEKALNIQGGVKDQLVNDNIVFQLERKAIIEMAPILSASK